MWRAAAPVLRVAVAVGLCPPAPSERSRARPVGAAGRRGAGGRSALRKRGSELAINSTAASPASTSTPAPGAPWSPRGCRAEAAGSAPSRGGGRSRAARRGGGGRGRSPPCSAGAERRPPGGWAEASGASGSAALLPPPSERGGGAGPGPAAPLPPPRSGRLCAGTGPTGGSRWCSPAVVVAPSVLLGRSSGW